MTDAVTKHVAQWELDRDQKHKIIDTALSEFTMSVAYKPKDLSVLQNERGAVKMDDLSKTMLDYDVTISFRGRHAITSEYHMGIGHIPDWNHRGVLTIDKWKALKEVFKTGRVGKGWSDVLSAFIGPNLKPILPEMRDVIWSFIQDSDVINYESFEQWADEVGYDPDSRSAEKTYHACLTTALKLRNAIGEVKLAELRELFQDY
mgnify:CR=1 FL=1